MMTAPYVAMIENRAEVTAQVRGDLQKDAERPGFSRVQVRVTATGSIGEWPDLFQGDIGNYIIVYVPDALAARFEPGTLVTFIAKKTGVGTAFAIPPSHESPN